MLIASYLAKELFLVLSLVKWLLDRGLNRTEVCEFTEYNFSNKV